MTARQPTAEDCGKVPMLGADALQKALLKKRGIFQPDKEKAEENTSRIFKAFDTVWQEYNRLFMKKFAKYQRSYRFSESLFIEFYKGVFFTQKSSASLQVLRVLL